MGGGASAVRGVLDRAFELEMGALTSNKAANR